MINFKQFLIEGSQPSPEIWRVLDETAELIKKKGYGSPIRELIAKEPMFQAVKYGKQVCDTDVLFDRLHKQLQKNIVIKNLSFAERMILFLCAWSNRLGDGLDGPRFNPDRLKLSEWVQKPLTVYRGITKDSYEQLTDKSVLPQGRFYSFTLDKNIAWRFTIPGYAAGHFSKVGNSDGYVVKAEVKPIEFHAYLGLISSDEKEAIISGPVTIEVVERMDSNKLVKLLR
jgi:hypothetical protein